MANVAQRIECLTVAQDVAGSSPVVRPIYILVTGSFGVCEIQVWFVPGEFDCAHIRRTFCRHHS